MYPAGQIILGLHIFFYILSSYAKLAAKACAITAEESILIASMEGYANKEARRMDAKRHAENIQTRVGHKKAEAMTIRMDMADALK
jgi:hypothetical protein